MRLFSLLTMTAVVLMTASNTSAAPPKQGDKVSDFELQSIDGETVALSGVLEETPAVVVVLRGYPGGQCPLCSRQFGDYMNNAEKFDELGVSVVFVYPGDVDDLDEKAKEFVGEQDLPEGTHFLLDPNYEFTNAWDLRWKSRRETAYPSTFLVGQNGIVAAAQVSQTHGGRTNAKDVLSTVASIAQGDGSSSRSKPGSGKKPGSGSR